MCAGRNPASARHQGGARISYMGDEGPHDDDDSNRARKQRGLSSAGFTKKIANRDGSTDAYMKGCRRPPAVARLSEKLAMIGSRRRDRRAQWRSPCPRSGGGGAHNLVVEEEKEIRKNLSLTPNATRPNHRELRAQLPIPRRGNHPLPAGVLQSRS